MLPTHHEWVFCDREFYDKSATIENTCLRTLGDGEHSHTVNIALPVHAQAISLYVKDNPSTKLHWKLPEFFKTENNNAFFKQA